MKQPNRNIGYFRSPKRKSKTNKVEFYSYYAGYSEVFVEDVLDYLQLEKDSIILDPWNGSGTTTYVVEQKGYEAIGFDINPVMPVVASARRITITELDNLMNYSERILKQAMSFKSNYVPKEEPLKDWLGKSSIIILRRIERAIQRELLLRKNYLYAKKPVIYNNLLCNPELSFFYVALFRTVKDLLSSFKSSNPTWIKVPRGELEKLEFGAQKIFDCFKKNVNLMMQAVLSEEKMYRNNKVILDVASSKSIPLKDSFVDAVIASPPYCTRIDYAITTRLELAILGFGYDKMFEELRSQMIGTLKTIEDEIAINVLWGETAAKFLSNVRNHKSKASQTYYVKQYLQYFHNIYLSLSDINRVLKKKGYAVIVVQDSYYKEVHLDLPKIFVEMGMSFGWRLVHSEAFYQHQTLAAINKRKKMYRSNSSAVEKVLVFQKGD